MAVEYYNPHNNTIKVNGDKALNMEMDTIKIKSIIIFMQENLLKESKQEKDILSMVMALYIQESFIINFHMEQGISNMLIKINMQDNLLKEKNKEKESIILVKAPFLLEYGKMIKKYKVNLSYSMEIPSKGHSKITKDIMVYTNTEMVTYIKAHGKMT